MFINYFFYSFSPQELQTLFPFLFALLHFLHITKVFEVFMLSFSFSDDGCRDDNGDDFLNNNVAPMIPPIPEIIIPKKFHMKIPRKKKVLIKIFS